MTGKENLAGLVQNGQRPGPAGQLAGDGDVSDDRPFAAGGEGLPAVMKPPVAFVATGPRRRGGVLPAGPHDLSEIAVALAMVPGSLDQQPAGVGCCRSW